MSSLTARELSDHLITGLLKAESALYLKIMFLMKHKGTIGDKLMTHGITPAQIKSCYEMSKFLDSEIEPLAAQHLKVVEQLKRFGVVVKHN